MTALAKLRDRFNGARHTKDFCVDAKTMADALDEIDAALSHEGEAKALGGNETLNLLNDVRKFIEAEYADPSAGPDGEWIAKEARPIHDRICRVLANSPKDATLSAPEARVRRDWHYDQDGYCDNPARGY